MMGIALVQIKVIINIIGLKVINFNRFYGADHPIAIIKSVGSLCLVFDLTQIEG